MRLFVAVDCASFEYFVAACFEHATVMRVAVGAVVVGAVAAGASFGYFVAAAGAVADLPWHFFEAGASLHFAETALGYAGSAI